MAKYSSLITMQRNAKTLLGIFPLLFFLFQSCFYRNYRSPGWYYSQNYTDVKGLQTVGTLSGETCATGWFWVIYLGDESYDTAVKHALADKADMLFDVKTDYFHSAYFLNLYFKNCTKVTGIGVKLPETPKAIESKENETANN